MGDMWQPREAALSAQRPKWTALSRGKVRRLGGERDNHVITRNLQGGMLAAKG
jgi:hypothetical protein